jgi:hypothetical protein
VEGEEEVKLGARHLDIGPLERHVRASHPGNGSVHAHGYRNGQHVSTIEFAHHLGFERSTVYKWRKDGIPLHTADAISRDLGLHVLNIWPDAYDDIDPEVAA